jgi:hypothetical protein
VPQRLERAGMDVGMHGKELLPGTPDERVAADVHEHQPVAPLGARARRRGFGGQRCKAPDDLD